MKNLSIKLSILFFLLTVVCVAQTRREDCNCIRLDLTNDETYVLSAWVKEKTDEQLLSYDKALVEMRFFDEDGTFLETKSFSPNGPMIDGWQKIESTFKVPSFYGVLEFVLRSIDSATDVYFDDIRVQPFNSNLKSFVYDPQSLRLMAELDENNFATYYEYDQEGGLVRVKKETEKGVFTIQESRSKTAIDQ